MTSDEDKKKKQQEALDRLAELDQELNLIPHPHQTKFVRYGTGPGEYFEPVQDWRNRHERD